MSKIQLSYDAIYPDRVRFHRKVLNSQDPVPASRTSCKVQVVVFLTNWLQINQLPKTQFLGSVNLLQWVLVELRKIVYLLDFQLVNRMWTSRRDTESQDEERHGTHAHHPEALLASWGFLHRHHQFNLSACPRLPRGREVFNPLITGFILLPAKWHLTSLYQWGHTEVAVLRPGSIGPGAKSDSTLVLDFSASRNVRNKLDFKPPGLWCVLLCRLS